MTQAQLWTPAVEAVAVTAHVEQGRFWYLTVDTRRSGMGWGDEPRSVYGDLSTDEMMDALLGDLYYRLGRS